jgi:hypothetical protein
MSRPAAIARDPFVLRHAEVARDYFRQSPASFTPAKLIKLHPTFPRPRHDGLYLREAVEAWVRKSFGVDVHYPSVNHQLIMERAKYGRQGQTP